MYSFLLQWTISFVGATWQREWSLKSASWTLTCVLFQEASELNCSQQKYPGTSPLRPITESYTRNGLRWRESSTQQPAMSSLQTSFSAWNEWKGLGERATKEVVVTSFKACGTCTCISNKEDGSEDSDIHCLKPAGVAHSVAEELAAQLHVHGPYSGEERWANDSDDPFADMEELEEDEAATDDDWLGNCSMLGR